MKISEFWAALLEQELEITSSNEDDQLPQEKADLMATSQGIPADGEARTSRGKRMVRALV
ncbi:hypothetical protein IWQ61_008712 [Dispira simplex]|nr:hypothetical protein IWQ61_008712 [Dispira simplex]